MDLILKSSQTALDSKDTTIKRLYLRPDETKKSVFWLDDAKAVNHDDARQDIKVSVPAHVEGIITRFKSAKDNDTPSNEEKEENDVFAWGGMQLTSNAKAIEIYYTAPQGKQEIYLTTVKGLPGITGQTEDDDDDQYLLKALCAVPGGPRAAVSVRFKFLSLQPKGTTTFRLATLKWTARVAPPKPPAPSTSSPNAFNGNNNPNPHAAGTMPSMAHLMMSMGGSATANSFPFGIPHSSLPQQQTQQQQAAPAMTQEDIGAAMAGMSFALRSTEERLHAQLQKAATTNQLLYNQVYMLSQQMAQQSQLIQQQTSMLQQQQIMLLEQTKTMQELKEQIIMSIKVEGTAKEPKIDDMKQTKPTGFPKDMRQTPVSSSTSSLVETKQNANQPTRAIVEAREDAPNKLVSAPSSSLSSSPTSHWRYYATLDWQEEGEAQ